MASSSVPSVRINENAPLWRVVDAVAASGWGDVLRGAPQSVRTYLLAFARVANARSAIAEVTDAQLSERTGLSIRTMERARKWLVEHDFLVVLRRGARQGLKGVASILYLAKDALLELIPSARTVKDEREQRRQQRQGGFKGKLGSWSRTAATGRQSSTGRVVKTTYAKGAAQEIAEDQARVRATATGAGKAAFVQARARLGL